ncbi:MAG: helix-turn-helix transcriptional regulator [Ancrocorticia sp.]
MVKNEGNPNSRMKAARASFGLTQAELAKAVGVSRQTISMIEAGTHNPTLNLCRDICRALHTDLNALFWDEP